jgi:hypothetical protein
MADLRELWGVKSFRARIFFAIVPTVMAMAFGALATDRTRPYDFILSESYIHPASGKGGTQVVVNWKVHSNRSHVCPGTIERVIIDPETGVVLATYTPTMANSQMPLDGWIRNTFLMPHNMKPGVVGYRSKLAYTCNWFQALFPSFAIHYESPTLLFTIEDASGQ